MFGFGIGEILVILVVALIVFGPDKLPEIARTLGRSMAELRRSVDDFKHELTLPRLDQDSETNPSQQTEKLPDTCESKTASLETESDLPSPEPRTENKKSE